MIVTITLGLEARIVILYPLILHLSNREVAGMKIRPCHLPKEHYYHVKQLLMC